MAASHRRNKPEPLVGEAFVRAMVADEKLVAETNEAWQDRAREGEPGNLGSRVSDIKAWLDDPSRPRPI